MLDLIVRRGFWSSCLGIFFGFSDFLHVFGRFFFEIFEAALAAKLDFLSLLHKYIGLAHVPIEFLAGNDTSL